MKLRTRLLIALLLVAAVAVLLTALLSRQSRLVETSIIVYDVSIDDASVDSVEKAYLAGGGSWDLVPPVLERIDFDWDVRVILAEEPAIDESVDLSTLIFDSRFGEPLPETLDQLGYYEVGRDYALFTFDSADPSVVTRGLGSRLDRRLALSALAAMVIATLGAVLLSHRISRPMQGLVETVRGFSAGDRTVRAVPATGEIGELGVAFNELAEGLDRSERVRRSMAADTAHELRTPLANLRGHLEAVQDGVVEPDEATISGLIADVEQLSHLVNDLQSLSLAEAGAVTLHLVPVSAASIVDRVVTAHRERASQNGVTITADVVPATLPVVAVDPQRIEQVFDNLVSNATRYASTITVSARPAGDGPDAGVAFDIRDDGPGIPAEHLEHIFERFHRVDPARQRSTGGGGLGLAIARQMVELHQGELRVVSSESGPERGSTFTVQLPAAE